MQHWHWSNVSSLSTKANIMPCILMASNVLFFSCVWFYFAIRDKIQLILLKHTLARHWLVVGLSASPNAQLSRTLRSFTAAILQWNHTQYNGRKEEQKKKKCSNVNWNKMRCFITHSYIRIQWVVGCLIWMAILYANSLIVAISIVQNSSWA